MEVIKEKDLTQSTSASWVRAIDSAGNPIKINANDLMALMSEATASSKGLMSASGFMDRGTIYDANLCIENGTYYCPDNTVNAPTTYRYVLIAFKHKVGSIIQYRQIAFQAPTSTIADSYNVMYIRYGIDNVGWSKWKQITATIL